MTYDSLCIMMDNISSTMKENRDYLISLDQKNGDGDLGLYMVAGFSAVADYLRTAEERDLGKLLMKCSSVFNESAPSSLGTIISFGFMGLARALKGKTEASLPECADALEAAVNFVMTKSESKQGDKTILDAVIPAVSALKEHEDDDVKVAVDAAARAAAEGSEETKNMYAVHGRAAYYRENSLGVLDGGSVVGRLIFEGIAESY